MRNNDRKGKILIEIRLVSGRENHGITERKNGQTDDASGPFDRNITQTEDAQGEEINQKTSAEKDLFHGDDGSLQVLGEG